MTVSEQKKNMTGQRQKRSLALILIVIFAVALSVRIIGIKFSFPLLTHHDEAYSIDPLISMSQNGTLDSGFYNRPGQISYIIQYTYLNIVSRIQFGTNFADAYFQNPLLFYFFARLITAIQGALIPVVAFLIGKRYKILEFAFPGAFLTLFYSSFVGHSHYLTPDVPITLYTLVIILFCLLYVDSNRFKWLAFAAGMVAINTLEKYPGILSYGIVLVAIGIQSFTKIPKSKRLKFFLSHLLFTFAIMALAAFIIAPHLFFKWEQVREVLLIEGRSTHLGADGLNWIGNMLFYVKEFVKAAGWIVSALGIVGIFTAIRLKEPKFLLLFYGMGYWVALSKLGLHWERWSLPMVITPLLLAAVGFSHIYKTTISNKLLRTTMLILFIFAGSLFVVDGLSSSIRMTWKDTRVVGLEYLQANSITPENSISEGYTPFFPRYATRIFDFDLENPGNNRFIILSSNIYGRYYAEPERYINEITFYEKIRQETNLVKEVKPSPVAKTYPEKIFMILDYFKNLLGGWTEEKLTGPTIQIFEISN